MGVIKEKAEPNNPILIDNIVVLYLYVLLYKHILALAHTICS